MKHGSFLRMFCCTVLATAASAYAQLPTTQLTSVFPPGGKQGTSVEVTIAGADMDDCSRLLFSHSGITATAKMTTATALEPARPIANQFSMTIGLLRHLYMCAK